MAKTTTKSLFDAAAAEIAEVGYAGLSVKGVVDRAGVSDSFFHSHFADELALVEAAQQDLFERFFARLLRACGTQSSWPLKVKVGVGATLDLAAAAPAKARFLVVDSPGINRRMAQRAIEYRDRLAGLLAPGRTEITHGDSPPDIIEPLLVGGLIGVIEARVVSDEAAHLPALAPQLVEMLLLPYLGAEAAAEVARRPRPKGVP
jgi:AcrR family transcriptional regulator